MKTHLFAPLSRLPRRARPIILTAAITAAAAAQAQTPFSLNATTYSENFDGMAAAIGASLPSGWVYNAATAYTGGTTVTTRAAGTTGTGSLNGTSAGGNYVFVNGVLASGTDKAIGFVSSSSFPDNTNILFGFTNNTGGAITDLTLGFDYEKYRTGTSDRAWSLFGSTDGTTWGNAITAGGVQYAADAANAVVNPPTTISKSGIVINGLNIGVGQSYFLRWNYDGSGTGTNAQGLGIDNFSLSATLGVFFAPLYWDANGSAGVGGVSGVWDAATANWNPNADGTGALQAIAPQNKAIFAQSDTAITAATVTIAAGGVTSSAGIQFDSTGFTVGGGPLTLGAGGSNVTVTNAGDTATISAAIGGTAGLSKTGAGRLVLSGANTFTGITAVNGGVLEISSNANLGDDSADLTISGGTLRTTANVSLAAGRDFSGTGTFDLQGHALTFNGAVAAGALAITGGGSVAFAGTSAATGALSFDSATTLSSTPTLVLSGNLTTTHTTGTVTVNATIAPGATRTYTVSDSAAAEDLVLNGGFTGAGRVAFSGPPTAVIRLNGDSSAHTGGIRLDAGAPTLLLGNANALGTGQLFLNGGTIAAAAPLVVPTAVSFGGNATFTGSPLTLDGSITFFGVSQKTVTVNNALTIAGKLGDAAFAGTGGASGTSSGGLTFAGSGTVTLANGANDIADVLAINGPTLVLSGSLSAASSFLHVQAGELKYSGFLAGTLSIGDTNGSDDALFSPSPGSAVPVSLASLSLFDDAVLKLELDSTGGAIDTLFLTGATFLGAGVAKLQLTDLGNTALAQGTAFTLLDGVSGMGAGDFFENLLDLAQFRAGVNVFEIDYAAGPDGQDILLRVVPEPGSVALALLGGALLFRRRRVR